MNNRALNEDVHGGERRQEPTMTDARIPYDGLGPIQAPWRRLRRASLTAVLLVALAATPAASQGPL